MTVQRATAYIGGIALLGAWLASAASTSRRAASGVDAAPQAPAGRTRTELIARDVQAQSERLRKRLASPPLPQQPHRNPFMFGERVRAPRPMRRPDPQPLPAVTVPVLDEPPLVLIGIAENGAAAAAVRTAMIAGEGDQLFFAKPGDTILGRYTIEIVGVDVVQMKDRVTSATRRLALR